MPRRRRDSPLDGLVELVALMPWWVGVLGSIVSYVVLHRIAGTPPEAVPYKPGQLTATITPALWHGLATVGQYLLPFIFSIAAATSAWRKHERRRLVRDTAQAKSAAVLDGMTWAEFEKLVGESFRQQGYAVEETGGGGADGGVDLVLRRGGEKFLVQCKQWRAFRVGVDVVRQLYGVMAARGAAGGFVVTSGRFTADATEFASGRNIVLVDGPKLLGMIRQARTARAQTTMAASVSIEPAASTPAAPICPTCARPMTRRTAKRGSNAGTVFWGCTGYPACKGTRPID